MKNKNIFNSFIKKINKTIDKAKEVEKGITVPVSELVGEDVFESILNRFGVEEKDFDQIDKKLLNEFVYEKTGFESFDALFKKRSMDFILNKIVEDRN